MNTTALEKLMFTVGMKDMVSPQVKGINRTMAGMKQNAQAGFGAVRDGAFGLAGSVFAIKSFMAPVYEMQRALGEVRSLGVADSALQQLEKTALNFSMQYGESATDFVKSSYDIQSAIGGLTDRELTQFTEASNVLAKGTKADAATVTSYMGTMYGIFKNQADAMGRAEWVTQLTGQTAAAVQMFKTTGSEMSSAFTSLGASATSAGVSANEQMAILGQLQATMSGSEAGTKYSAFLASAGKAQQELGLQFTDSQGRLLPMVQILEQLQGRFGSTFDEMESLQLKEAFGTKEAVDLIKLLMNDTGGLAENIDKLGRINGMKNAEDMAKAMVDPWEQFTATTEALRIKFGEALLPTVNDLLSTLSGGLGTVASWTEEFPNITRWVGLATLGILGLSAATSVITMLMGFGRLAMVAWSGVMLIGRGIMLAVSASMWVMRGAVIALNFAMRANPIGVVITLLSGLVMWIGHTLGWWSKLYTAFADSSIGQGIMSFIRTLIGALGKVAEWLGFDSFSFDVGSADAPDATAPSWANVDDLPTLEHNQVRTAASGNQLNAQQLRSAAGTQYGDVHINAEGGMRPEDMEAWAALNGG